MNKNIPSSVLFAFLQQVQYRLEMKTVLRQSFSITVAFLIANLFCLDASFGQISLTSANYTQNFNTLANSGTSSTLPAGWVLSEAGGNSIYTAGTGSSTTGDTYSFGAALNTDRAFGGLQSGTVVPTIGASFQNNTGSTLSLLTIQYTGEQWRLGATGRVDRLDFQYSTNATSLTTGTWTDFNGLDFTAPVTTGATGALDGNASANRTLLAGTITGLSLANGANIWIRWNDFGATGSDDGLGVDDFSISTTSYILSSSSNFTVPAGVTCLQVEAWGGGGGASNIGGTNAGGGGGGGAYSRSILKVSDTDAPYSVTIGSGGAAGSAGNPSSFGSLVIALGGGSISTATGASGGLASGGTGDVKFSGGNGGNGGGNNQGGGGGGGSAFFNANGGNFSGKLVALEVRVLDPEEEEPMMIILPLQNLVISQAAAAVPEQKAMAPRNPAPAVRLLSPGVD